MIRQCVNVLHVGEQATDFTRTVQSLEKRKNQHEIIEGHQCLRVLVCMPNKSIHRYWPYLQIRTEMTSVRMFLSVRELRSVRLSLISIHLFTGEKKRKTKATNERQVNSCQTKTVQERGGSFRLC